MQQKGRGTASAGFLTIAGALAVIAGLGTANAAVEKLDFTTTYNGGTFNGETLSGYMLLDVNGSGLATSGTLTISGAGLPGTETMGLVPVSQVCEAGDGTELFGNDNVIRITTNGVTFGTNAPSSLNGGYTLQFLVGGEFGECASNVVCGFIAGPRGDGNLYNQLGPTTITQTAVPEPSTWAMMLVGFAGLGSAGWRASKRTSRRFSRGREPRHLAAAAGR